MSEHRSPIRICKKKNMEGSRGKRRKEEGREMLPPLLFYMLPCFVPKPVISSAAIPCTGSRALKGISYQKNCLTLCCHLVLTYIIVHSFGEIFLRRETVSVVCTYSCTLNGRVRGSFPLPRGRGRDCW